MTLTRDLESEGHTHIFWWPFLFFACICFATKLIHIGVNLYIIEVKEFYILTYI